MTNNLPTGTVTFLFTDIEGSTKLAQEYPDEMPSLLARHNHILNQAIEAHYGFVFQVVGDSYSASFHNANDALRAAVEAQRFLHNEAWSPAPITVRMGINAGAAELKEDSTGVFYEGYATLALTQRIMSAGHGGQILLSQSAYDLTRDRLLEKAQLVDMGKRHLKDVLRPEHLYQLSVPDMPSEFPPLKTLESFNHNLPAQLTSFIGREREMTEAAKRLENARLLTLIGPGGTGKTRLSIQLGAQLLSIFKDGVWLVEFAPIADPSLIMQTIASAFDIGEVPGAPLKTLVHDYLRDKHVLLILDNCEHLVEASAKVVDELLHVAPNIKIIASSREALGINGETVYRVPSLSLPNQDKVTKEAAMGCESVQLFVERANAANRKFQLTDANASFVAQICSRLDGIPLAIELAASRVTVFSPEQIAKRLDDRFKLLTGGSRTALPRQQTLRALIDWSYDLLSEGERALLRRLSVFSGGWTFEAAETICNNVDVFEHLPQLVNKSLVTVNDEGGEPRYFLLETIRQYARDKLLESGEGEGTRSRHLIYYLEMAETAFPEMLTREKELEWIKKLEIEYDNIRVAVKWGLDTNLIAAMRLVRSLTYWFMVTSYNTEGHGWGKAALERVKMLTDHGKILTSDENLHLARLLAAMSILSITIGDGQASAMEAEQATTLLRSLDDKWTLAIALAFHTGGKITTGKFNEAIASIDEALRLAEELGDRYVLGLVMTAASFVEFFVNRDVAKAYTFREKASELLREHGSRYSYGLTVLGFGELLVQQGQFQKAREELNSAMQTMQEIGSTRHIVNIKSVLAHVMRREGNYLEAIPAYHETIKEWQRMGYRSAVAHQLECLAFIAKSLEQVEKATKLLGAAEALRQKIESDMTLPERKEYEKEVADIKANMDGKEFASLWAEGRSMEMDQAIELALGE